ncbi:hypothetical protein FS837_004408 [Tulasnella sp. UAMH 9824]|nr:hypothetical protein FS837_004408 [Tulasnella sp. UAMH 9824]
MPSSRARRPRREADSSSSHASDADDELGDASEDMTDGTDTDIGDESSLGRGTSPAPSLDPSLYSYRSSVDGDILLKDLYGRVVNSTSQHSRLDMQHEMLKKIRNGLFFAAEDVRRALAPREDVESQPAVLDIGSGSGSWMVDMAKMFPHAEIVGVDLVPANLSE